MNWRKLAFDLYLSLSEDQVVETRHHAELPEWITKDAE
jgi:hypothetical protein